MPLQAELSAMQNRVPPRVRHIHLIGIGGTGMASIAGLLLEMGYRVTGSDQALYPPMSELLQALGIQVMEGYREENLASAPDLVIVGNVITRTNPEAVGLARRGLPYLSFPQALRHFVLRHRRPLVIAGTHGKTTTSSLLVWILLCASQEPGYLIGGIPLNTGKGFQVGRGPFFVVEGDEYDTAFFDKGPKFLHYAPRAAVITGIEFDHADIYRDLKHVRESFRRFMGILPPEGLLVANGDDPVLMEELNASPARVVTYGFGEHCLCRALSLSLEPDHTAVTVSWREGETLILRTPIYGRHNVRNLLAATALSRAMGIGPGPIQEAACTFAGVRRRQEIVGRPRDVLIIDDFAHHPTAVSETLEAIKERHPSRRLVAAFEPRSNSSRRKVFQERYARSFEAADLVLVPEPPLLQKVPSGERFSSKRLVQALREHGQEAHYFATTDRLLEALRVRVRPGDAVVFMSNGAFDDLPRRLCQHLDEAARS